MLPLLINRFGELYNKMQKVIFENYYKDRDGKERHRKCFCCFGRGSYNGS